LRELAVALPRTLERSGCARQRSWRIFPTKVLALAIQKDFLRKLAFEELFVPATTLYLAPLVPRLGMSPEHGLELMQQLFCASSYAPWAPSNRIAVPASFGRRRRNSFVDSLRRGRRRVLSKRSRSR